jgi:hypothetical protein
MNALDILCRCGHTEAEHKNWYGYNTARCELCFSKFTFNEWTVLMSKFQTAKVNATWHNYQPDNLTHIEQLAKQKGLV